MDSMGNRELASLVTLIKQLHAEDDSGSVLVCEECRCAYPCSTYRLAQEFESVGTRPDPM